MVTNHSVNLLYPGVNLLKKLWDLWRQLSVNGLIALCICLVYVVSYVFVVCVVHWLHVQIQCATHKNKNKRDHANCATCHVRTHESTPNSHVGCMSCSQCMLCGLFVVLKSTLIHVIVLVFVVTTSIFIALLALYFVVTTSVLIDVSIWLFFVCVGAAQACSWIPCSNSIFLCPFALHLLVVVWPQTCWLACSHLVTTNMLIGFLTLHFVVDMSRCVFGVALTLTLQCTQGYKMLTMAPTSSHVSTCEIILLTVGSAELPIKLNVKFGVDQKLNLYLRLAEKFVYEVYGDGYDDALPRFEMAMLDDDGERVVLQENQTPEQCWDAKANRKYYMCARQLPDMDDTRGQAPWVRLPQSFLVILYYCCII